MRNVDEDVAQAVADGLGMTELPQAIKPARAPVTDLAPSPALSILQNGPDSFAGRKLGVLVTDGTDASLLAAVQDAAAKQDVTVELVAPTVGGVNLSDGNRVPAGQKIDGGPSVLYDAVVILPSAAKVEELSGLPAARDFANDAFAHCKFIGHSPEAEALFEACGLAALMDDGFVALSGRDDVDRFLARCAELRFWERQMVSA